MSAPKVWVIRWSETTYCESTVLATTEEEAREVALLGYDEDYDEAGYDRKYKIEAVEPMEVHA